MEISPIPSNENAPSPAADPQNNKTDEKSRQLAFGEFKKIKTSLSASSFRGPIPPPQLLAEYNKVIPNAAERILTMAESQQNHRQYMEKSVIDADSRQSDRGLILGFVVVMVLGIGGIILIANGHSVEGLAGVLLPISTLAGVFIYAQRSRRAERLARSRNESDKALDNTENT